MSNINNNTYCYCRLELQPKFMLLF